MIYERDEIIIIGIIPDNELDSESMNTDTEELKKIFYDALCLGPMYDTLHQILVEKKYLDASNRIKCWDVVKALNTNKFLQDCPNFVSSRETLVNIKLITAALIILKNNYLTVDTIRHALTAFELECMRGKDDDKKSMKDKENEDERLRDKNDFLYLEDGKVQKALRLINKNISDQILRKWFEHVKTNLEWNKPDRRKFEREYKEKKIDVPFIMPHEFLFLICNSINRLETIKKMHDPIYKSQKFSQMYQWELSDGKSIKIMQEQKQFRNLHLLNLDYRHKRNPKQLVELNLKKLEEGKHFGDFKSMDPKKDGKVLAYIEQSQKQDAVEYQQKINNNQEQTLPKSTKLRTQKQNSQSAKEGSAGENRRKSQVAYNTHQIQDQNLQEIKKTSYDHDFEKLAVEMNIKQVELPNSFDQQFKLMNNIKNYVQNHSPHRNQFNDRNIVTKLRFDLTKNDLQKHSQTALLNIHKYQEGNIKINQYLQKNYNHVISQDLMQGQSNTNQIEEKEIKSVNKVSRQSKFESNAIVSKTKHSPEQKKKREKVYIQSKIPDQKHNQKKLMFAVSTESRLNGNPNSTFIDDNQKQFMKVSKLNLKRAEQISKQFYEQRKNINDQFNTEYKDTKVQLNTKQTIDNIPRAKAIRLSQQQNNFNSNSLAEEQLSKSRAISAYRSSLDMNLRNQSQAIIYSQDKNISGNKSITRNKQQTEDQMSAYNDNKINKQQIIERFLQGEINKFQQRKQSIEFQQQLSPVENINQYEQQVNLVHGDYHFHAGKASTNSQQNLVEVNKSINDLFIKQKNFAIAADTIHSQKDYKQIDFKAHTDNNFNNKRASSKHGKNTSSLRYDTKEKVVTISTLVTRREQTSSQTHVQNQFSNSNQLQPEAFRTLMFVKSPKDRHKRQNEIDTSKINMKYTLGLQSGLINAGKLKRDHSRVSGYVGSKFGNMTTHSGNSKIKLFTMNKRPVSSYHNNRNVKINIVESYKFSNNFTNDKQFESQDIIPNSKQIIHQDY